MRLPHPLSGVGDRVRAVGRGAGALARERSALLRAGGGSALARSRSERTLRPEHMSILDGETLNLCLPLTGSLAGPVDGAVVLRVGHRRGEAAAWPMTVRDGRAEVTARIDPHWFRPGLVEREFLAFKATVDGRMFDLVDPPTTRAGGPTVSVPPRPDLGFALAIVRGYGGRAFVTATPTRPRAEVVSTRGSWTSLTVTARVLGVPIEALTSDVARLEHRGTGRRTDVPVSYEGDHVTIGVPATALVGAGDGEHVWDLRLPTTAGSLRLGRWINDVRDPKETLRRPPRYLATPDGAAVHAQFYFTPAGSLALRTSPLFVAKDHVS